MRLKKTAEKKINLSFIRLTVLPLLLLSISCFSAKAAHIIGGEMSYVCNGNGNYTVTIKMYRDCNGGGALFDSQPYAPVGQVTVYEGDSQFPFESVILDPPQITPLDENISNQCLSNIPNLCVEEGIYVFDINLPSSSDSYHITYQRCCRNQTISNIIDPTMTGATFTVEITPKAQNSCNNSPYFNDYPPIVICVNEPLQYDHSATDPESDSLVYEFCAPLKGGSQADVAPMPDAYPPYESVDFIMPTYSAVNPLAGNPIVSIDSATGLITGTPENIGQYVVGVCVREYRNGELVSITQRDFQFNVTLCNFTVNAELNGQSADGINFVYETCGALEMDLLNESFDLQNISAYQWQFETPGVSPATSSNADLSVQLAAPGTYEGWMILNPGTACTDIAYVTIHAYPTVELDISYDYESCGAGPVQFTPNTATPLSSILSWSWDFGDGTSSMESAPLHQYTTVGLYQVVLTTVDLNNCTHTFQQEVDWDADPAYLLDAALDGITTDGEHFEYKACGTLSLDLFNESTDPANIDSYLWQFTSPGISPATSTDADLSVQLAGEGTYEGMMILNPGDVCNSDTAYVTITAFPEVEVTMEQQYDPCSEGAVYFIPVSTASETTIVAWSWNFGDGATSQEPLPAHQYAAVGTYPVSLSVIDIYGCSYTFLQEVAWLPETELILEAPPTFSNCIPVELDLNYLSELLNANYKVTWDLGDSTLVNTFDVHHFYENTGVYDLHLEVTSPQGCVYDFDYPEWVTAEEPPIADFAYRPDPVNKKEEIQFENLSERSVSWDWNMGGEWLEGENPVWEFATAGNFEVELFIADQYGCEDSITQLIEVLPVFEVYVPNAFSPNDDGVNDVFRAYSNCPLNDYKMKVFDRWGAQIFESDDMEDGWNGFHQNEGYGTGVYVWFVTYVVDERERMLKGDVTLVR